MDNNTDILELIKQYLLYICLESEDNKETVRIYKSPLFLGHPVDAPCWIMRNINLSL